MENEHIRRQILELLYELYNDDPEGVCERKEIAQKLGLPVTEVKKNLAYLSSPEKRLVSIRQTIVGGWKYFFVKITVAGVDLVENPNEFNEKYPPQVFFQNFAGDKLDISIGDNASDVTVGKDIIKVNYEVNHELQDTTASYLNSLRNLKNVDIELEKAVTEQLSKLIRLIEEPKDLDLNQVREVKKNLEKLEGHPAFLTSELFSHPSIVRPVKKAVGQIIGH